MFVKYDNLTGPDLHAQRLRQREIKNQAADREKTARFCNDGNLLAFKETVARHFANSLPSVGVLSLPQFAMQFRPIF